jgi:hypothetical protein
MKTIRNTLIASALVLAPTLAHAGTGAEGYFTIYNKTDNNVIVGFYTNDGSGWSENWLGDDLEIVPGEGTEVEFIANTGECEQTFAVGWLTNDGGETIDDPIDIDICDASNVYLDDNEIYYD